jgi:hypothetical protein
VLTETTGRALDATELDSVFGTQEVEVKMKTGQKDEVDEKLGLRSVRTAE